MTAFNVPFRPIVNPQIVNRVRVGNKDADWRERRHVGQKLAFIRRSRNDWKLTTHFPSFSLAGYYSAILIVLQSFPRHCLEGLFPSHRKAGRGKLCVGLEAAFGRYVDGLGRKHASPRDEPRIPAVTRFRVDLSRGSDALWFCNESLRRGRPRAVRLSISISPNQSQRVPPLFAHTCGSLWP